MRAVIQRVTKAGVTVNGEQVAAITNGMLVLLGIGTQDTQEDIQWLSHKIANLRIFNDEDGIMNKSLMAVNGDMIVVSQFTLMASTKKGNRPSYIQAARPETAVPRYEEFVNAMEDIIGRKVHTGVFGADMKVELVNDGPVTIIIDTKNRQ